MVDVEISDAVKLAVEATTGENVLSSLSILEVAIIFDIDTVVTEKVP